MMHDPQDTDAMIRVQYKQTRADTIGCGLAEMAECGGEGWIARATRLWSLQYGARGWAQQTSASGLHETRKPGRTISKPI